MDVPEVAPLVGLSAEAELTVTDADTALAVGSGDVAVLATPRLVALAEAATLAALAGRLDAGRTSVGTRVEFDHLAATAVGASVVARAQLIAASQRRLQFEITVYQGQAVVAQGRVERVVVDRDRFLAKAAGQAPDGTGTAIRVSR